MTAFTSFVLFLEQKCTIRPQNVCALKIRWHIAYFSTNVIQLSTNLPKIKIWDISSLRIRWNKLTELHFGKLESITTLLRQPYALNCWARDNLFLLGKEHHKRRMKRWIWNRASFFFLVASNFRKVSLNSFRFHYWQEFINKKGYPNWTQVTRVVEEGETPIFKQFFSGWRDEGEQVGLGKVFRQGALGKSSQCTEYQFCRKFNSRFVWSYLHFSHLQSKLHWYLVWTIISSPCT